jgi:hypothetical protein
MKDRLFRTRHRNRSRSRTRSGPVGLRCHHGRSSAEGTGAWSAIRGSVALLLLLLLRRLVGPTDEARPGEPPRLPRLHRLRRLRRLRRRLGSRAVARTLGRPA